MKTVSSLGVYVLDMFWNCSSGTYKCLLVLIAFAIMSAIFSLFSRSPPDWKRSRIGDYFIDRHKWNKWYVLLLTDITAPSMVRIKYPVCSGILSISSPDERERQLRYAFIGFSDFSSKATIPIYRCSDILNVRCRKTIVVQRKRKLTNFVQLSDDGITTLSTEWCYQSPVQADNVSDFARVTENVLSR